MQIHRIHVKDNERPNRSYTQLISEALRSKVTRTMVLSEIYEYLANKYGYFRQGDAGWKVNNCINSN